MRSIMGTSSFVALAVTPALPVMAANMPSGVTFFKNVNDCEGRSETLREGDKVLVIRNLIEKVANLPSVGIGVACAATPCAADQGPRLVEPERVFSSAPAPETPKGRPTGATLHRLVEAAGLLGACGPSSLALLGTGVAALHRPALACGSLVLGA